MSFLKVDASEDGTTYLHKDLGGIDEVYIGYTLTLPAAFAAMAAPGPIVSLLSDNTTPGTDSEGFQPDPTGPSFLEILGSSALAGSPTAGTHTVEIHAKVSTDTLVVTVDGTPTDLSGGGLFAAQSINQLDEFDLGGIESPELPGAVYYISDVTIGTTAPGSTEIMDEDFSGGPTFPNWDGANDGSDLAIVSGIAADDLVIKIYDLATTELADISGIAFEPSMTRMFGQARVFTLTAPAGHALLTTLADDDVPNLHRGDRKLLVWENGVIIFHGRIFITERNGDGTENLVTITAMMPLAELGYDPDKAGRPVRGPGGSFVEPAFVSSVDGGDAISGPDLILQALTNSLGIADDGDPNPGEAQLPIDLTTGTFDLDVPPAVDLSPLKKMGWPIMLGDFIQALVATGVCDVDERPVDPSEDISVGDPYLMSAFTAVSALGSDKSETVHFDYFTGDHNASQCRHVDDFGTINNKLYDYLGPPVPTGDPSTRWTGNITPTLADTDLHDRIVASRARYGGPGDAPGQFMSIRIFDTVGGESDSRPLYLALWAAEQGLRVEPRAMLYMTPAPGSAGLFDAPADFDIGDIIGSNVGDAFGVALADVQRVYGYTKSWDRQGVKRLSELITSADEAS